MKLRGPEWHTMAPENPITKLRKAAIVACVVPVVSIGSADTFSGSYDVKYQQVSTNCQAPVVLAPGKISLRTSSATAVTVDIERIPQMRGSTSKEGKINAKSKSGPLAQAGLTGVFSITGKIDPAGNVALMLVGEYSTSGRALCTQSWNVTGSRAKPTGNSPKK